MCFLSAMCNFPTIIESGLFIGCKVLKSNKNCYQLFISRLAGTGIFAAAMANALDKHDQQENLQREHVADSTLLKTKAIKRNLKKRQWVEWDTPLDEKTAAIIAAKRATFDPTDRVKRRKSALLLSYCGANYFGMQRNPGMRTIEEELFRAMVNHKWITAEGFEQAQNTCFQRAARTDKGVSAARQVCSIKLPDEVDVVALNADLPAEIRVFGVERATKGFNAKDHCNARTYNYTLPSVAFVDSGLLISKTKREDDSSSLNVELQNFRIDDSQLQRVREILALYEGTKNFHNFTSRKNFHDPSAKRFIMSFTCSEPYCSPNGVEFLTLKVKGQSFMLHQIRKMVGLVIAIVRGNTTTSTLDVAFTEERIDLPMAPGLGLVLDKVHYDRYNERYGKDGIHAPLTWEKQNTDVEAFTEKHIRQHIYEIECSEHPMLNWLEILADHSYDRHNDESHLEGKEDDNE